MDYSQQDIKELLGKKYDPERSYVLETHRGAVAKRSQGWIEMGKLPDSSNNDTGMMVVMMSPKPPPPPPEPKPKRRQPERGAKLPKPTSQGIQRAEAVANIEPGLGNFPRKPVAKPVKEKPNVQPRS